MRLARAFIGVVLALAIAKPARAEAPDLERAQALFNVGGQAYAKGDFKAAIEAFEEAYRVAQRPGILFSLGQAHRRQYHVDHSDLHLRAAVERYSAYLAVAASGARRADAAQALVELEPLVAKLGSAPMPAPVPVRSRTRLMVSSAVEGALVALDGGAPQPSPLIVDVAPGNHRVRVEAEGYFEDQRQAVAVEGGLVALDVPLRERPARLTLRTEAGADVVVDRRPMGRTPLAGPLDLAPGRHFVAVIRNGRRPHGEEVLLARGEAKTLDVELTISGQRTSAFVLAAGAAAGVVAGGVFTGIAFARQSSALATLDASAHGNITRAQRDAYTADAASREDWKRAAGGAFGAALGLGATALGLFAFDTPPAMPPPARDEGPKGPSRVPAPMEISVTPLVSPTFAGAGFTARF